MPVDLLSDAREELARLMRLDDLGQLSGHGVLAVSRLCAYIERLEREQQHAA